MSASDSKDKEIRRQAVKNATDEASDDTDDFRYAAYAARVRVSSLRSVFLCPGAAGIRRS